MEFHQVEDIKPKYIRMGYDDDDDDTKSSVRRTLSGRHAWPIKQHKPLQLSILFTFGTFNIRRVSSHWPQTGEPKCEHSNRIVPGIGF